MSRRGRITEREVASFNVRSPCAPSAPRPECQFCDRHAPHVPSDPERRPLTVCIDASIVLRGATCAFFFPALVSSTNAIHRMEKSYAR